MDLNDVYFYLGNAGTFSQIIVAIIASFVYNKYKNTFLKYFLIILWFIVFIDLVARFFYLTRGYNYIIYNVYHLINFCFLLILYRTAVKKKIHKKWILFFLVVYIFSFFINLFIQNYTTQIQTTPFIIGAITIIVSIVFYFSEVLNTNQVLHISKSLLFWISTGLLLYFVGKIPIRMVKNHWEEVNNYEIILIVDISLGILMNIFFIIGFICSEKNKQY